MRAVVMRDRKLVVDTLPDPEPGPGQVLVKTLACGICGSDLHALKFADQLVSAARRSGAPFVMDLARDVVMGHEFCAEILDYGPDCSRKLPTGARVCSMPVLLGAAGVQGIGYSNDASGGYGDCMLLSEALLLPVPNGLSTEHAALTEPVAVGLHAVEKARLGADDVPLVIGCGPVGLAVIAGLKLRGAGPIIAADLSSGRRELAAKLGADIVVDPHESSPYESWSRAAAIPSGLRPAVIFECVGVPGLIHEVMVGAPRGARIVVAGVCMQEDRIDPIYGITKELSVQFVLGYTPQEFSSALNGIAEGEIPVESLVTGKVGLDGVAEAFDLLASPGRHAKILVEPWREGEAR